MKPTDALLAILVPTLWSLGFTLSKAAFDTFPPILLIALRFGVTAMAFIWAVPTPARAVLWRIFLISVVSGSVQYSLAYLGLAGMDASTASLIIQMEVPFAALIAWIFLKERIGWRRAIGPVGGFTLIAWMAAFASPQLFFASLALESGQWEALTGAGLPQWGLVLYLGLVMNGVGYALWYHLLGKYDVNRCIPFLMLVPVVGVASAVVLLGETITWLIAAGGLVVVAGIGIITIERRVR